MKATPFDNRISTLAEGPLWHPEREQLFWFDILGRALHTRDDSGAKSWNFGEYASAAGWIDRDRLLVATETGLWDFNIESGARQRIADIEADNPATRSNDGRADPWGGFWIGTMGKEGDRDGAGAIYRFYRGEVRRLFGSITIPNSISFSPDRSHAYFSDTPTHKLLRVSLDPAQGWPDAEPLVFLDLSGEKLSPDGAVVDSEGRLWVALWGESKVAVYDQEGSLVRNIALSVPQVTCPAFGGKDLSTLYVTTAREHMDDNELEKFPESGLVFQVPTVGTGRAEPKVVL